MFLKSSRRVMSRSRGFFETLAGDGRPLLNVTALALLFSGAFAIYLSITGQFLPHDVAFLEQTAEELCRYSDRRIVAFMFHDRVAFGGSLLAIGTMYLWLAAYPLASRQAWAWWAFAVSGTLGFVSFLAWLGYGYLDTWHGAGTLFLLPCFIGGLVLSWRTLEQPRGPGALRRRLPLGDTVPHRSGRILLLATAGGMIAAGLMILGVGATTVFVPQDLEFMGLDRAALRGISERLIPLIAHDRAGFGGGLASAGVVVGMSVYYGETGRGLRQALLLAGTAGFGCAIGVHLIVGYTDFGHLAPAVAGAALFLAGIWLMRARVSARGP
jgi:hypothetical protein